MWLQFYDESWTLPIKKTGTQHQCNFRWSEVRISSPKDLAEINFRPVTLRKDSK